MVRSGKLWTVIDGTTWLYEGQERRRPTSNDIRFFFDFGLEVRPFDPFKDGALNEGSLRSALELEARRFRALEGLLIGMDAELDDDLRRRNMRRADRVLADPAVGDFIERRFLRPVPTQAWDLGGARRLAQSEELGRVGRLYAIVDGPLLLRLEDEVAAWATAQGQSSVECAVKVDKAYDSGLIAVLATAFHDGNESSVRARVFLAQNIEWDRRLAGHLVARFVQFEVPTDSEIVEAASNEPGEPDAADAVAQVRARIGELLDEYRSRKRREGHRHRGEATGADAFVAYESALKQIDWIAGRFESGRVEAAWQDVVELAERQLTEGDPDKLAMSFTNLATRLARHNEVAWALCDLAAECAADDPAVWTARAELLRSWGRLDEALAAYDRTVEDFPQNAVARNGRAETLRAMGRLDEALAGYDRTVEDFPENAVARNGRAETLRALGRFDEALAAYDRTVEDFPQDAFARTGRAETLRALGRFDEALAAYDRTVEDFPQDAFAQTGRAETLRALGRYDEALAAYNRAVEEFPENAVAWNGRAETLRALGRYDEALAAYDRTVEDFPQNAVARNGRAETLRVLERFDEALAACDRTVEDFPENTVARSGRAETLRALGRFDAALAAYDRTVEDFPHDAFARNGYAVVLGELDRFNEARAVLKHIEGRPRTSQDWVGLHILCMIDFREGVSEQLVQRLELFTVRCPFPTQRLYFETTLAVVRIALKRMREARRDLEAIAARPGLRVEERAAMKLMEAHVEAADGNFDAARGRIAEATNVVSFEEFKLRRLQKEIERRFGLGPEQALTRADEIEVSDKMLGRLEMDFWVSRATEAIELPRAA